MITQEDLKKILEYDAQSGVFTWKVSPAQNTKAGNVAGTIKDGYVTISIKGKRYYAHRLAWLYVYGKLPNNEIDHISHDKLDNSIDNLRSVTHTSNMRNKTKPKNNASGVVGVSWKKKVKRWQAQINIDGKQKHLGYFASFSDAVDARKNAEVLFGYHNNHGE